MREFLDDVSIERPDRGTTVRLRRRLRPGRDVAGQAVAREPGDPELAKVAGEVDHRTSRT